MSVPDEPSPGLLHSFYHTLTNDKSCHMFSIWEMLGCKKREGGAKGGRREKKMKAEGFGQLKDGRLQGKGVNEACSRRNLPQCVIS